MWSPYNLFEDRSPIDPRPWNELQWLVLKTEHQGSSLSNGRQEDMTHGWRVSYRPDHMACSWWLLQVLGTDRAPTMSDRGKLIYTEATLLEVQRIAVIGRYTCMLYVTTRNTFRITCPLYRENNRSQVNSPHKEPMTRVFQIFLLLAVLALSNVEFDGDPDSLIVFYPHRIRFPHFPL